MAYDDSQSSCRCRTLSIAWLQRKWNEKLLVYSSWLKKKNGREKQSHETHDFINRVYSLGKQEIWCFLITLVYEFVSQIINFIQSFSLVHLKFTMSYVLQLKFVSEFLATSTVPTT